jgi:hypothetical protein
MAERVNYFRYAGHLQALDLHATNADLVARLETAVDSNSTLGRECLAAVRRLPPDGEWFMGLALICQVLHDHNPRFSSGLFSEWALEGK